MKKDAPRVVIIDSCVYFRLARTLRPLLKRASFGPPPPYSLFIVPQLFDEYQRSPKLKSRFEWLMEEEFQADIWAIAVVVAMAENGFVLVTDDELMRTTATDIDIPCWGVLDLLKELEMSGNITSDLTDQSARNCEIPSGGTRRGPAQGIEKGKTLGS
jgi:hypothetical protein